MIFCISTTMPAAYWYVPRVTYVQKFHPTQVPPVVCCSFSLGEECGVAFLCCCSVPLPSFPWSIQNNFVTVRRSRVCWAFACRTLFQLRLLSFFQRFCLSFYSDMALVVLFCTMVWIKRSSWHSSSLPVAKGCSPTIGVIVFPSLKLRG